MKKPSVGDLAVQSEHFVAWLKRRTEEPKKGGARDSAEAVDKYAGSLATLFVRVAVRRGVGIRTGPGDGEVS